MNTGVERKATSLGVAAALILLALAVGFGFVFGSDPQEGRRSALPIADLDAEPLAGGTRTTLTEARGAFPVPLFRPDIPLASDATVSETWMRLGASPEVWIQYQSGVVVLVRPIGENAPTRVYAEANIAEGLEGRLITVEGVEAFLVPQNEDGSGSVRLVIDGVLVDVVGYIGDFSVEQLTEAAASVVKTSADVAAAEEA